MQVSSRIATDLAAAAQDAVVFLAPLRSDEPAPRGGELIAKLGGLVAGGLGARASSRPLPVSLAAAHTQARPAKVLLYLQPEIARGQLRITADVYRVTPNVWDRVRQPVPAPLAHGFATARIDAEVRSYLAPVPLLANHIERASIDDRDLVALACGDIDQDGSLELVTLGRRRAAMGRIRAGRFVPDKVVPLRDLAGVAPAPLREPLGSIAIVAPRGASGAHVDSAISDRAHGTRFDLDFRAIASIAGVPFASRNGDFCVAFQGSTLSATVIKCAEGDPTLEPADLETPLDVAAWGSFVTTDGAVHAIAATRDPRTAELRVRADEQVAAFPRAGAQVALADLDQDGAPEIISTLDVPPAKPSTSGSTAVSPRTPPRAPPPRARPLTTGAEDAFVITMAPGERAARARANSGTRRGARARCLSTRRQGRRPLGPRDPE